MFYKNAAIQCFQIAKSVKVKGVSSKSLIASSPQITPQNSLTTNVDLKTTEESSNFSLYNVKKIMKGSGRAFDEGFTCIRSECPACDLNKGKSTQLSTVFVNKTTGNFICSKCQHVAKWSIVERFFASSQTAKSKKELQKFHELFLESKGVPSSLPNLPKDVIAIESLSTKEIKEILIELNLEIIQPNALLATKCSYDKTKKTLYFPICDVMDQIVAYKVLKKTTSGFDESIRGGAAHFGVTAIRNPGRVASTTGKASEQTSAILVLNILDLLALGSQTKMNADIICLPDGLKSLPQECLPVLEKYQKLALWFNYDTAGWDIARNFAKKLDEKRCLFVRPTDASPTPFKALSMGLDLKGIYNKSHPILHKAITTFQALRQDVLSDLQNIDKVQGVKWQRYPALNKFLKGHRKGELTVLTGPTGCGKTTFMSEYSLDLALQGVTTLWGSFEIRNTRLASTLLRQLAGMPLDENIDAFDYWADEFEKLPIYFMTFHGQQTIKVVMDAIEHAQYVHDIHHVIIDNVQFMMGISDEAKHMDRFWKQDAIVAAFRTFATKRNCHVTLVIHPRKERDAEDLTTQSIFGGAKASQEADNVLIIQDKRLTSVRGKKFLQIAKNRYSGDLGIMPLDFDKCSLSYAPKKKRLPDEETSSS